MVYGTHPVSSLKGKLPEYPGRVLTIDCEKAKLKKKDVQMNVIKGTIFVIFERKLNRNGGVLKG